MTPKQAEALQVLHLHAALHAPRESICGKQRCFLHTLWGLQLLRKHLQGSGSAFGTVVCPVLGCATSGISVAACACKTSRQARPYRVEQYRPIPLGCCWTVCAMRPFGRPLADGMTVPPWLPPAQALVFGASVNLDRRAVLIRCRGHLHRQLGAVSPSWPQAKQTDLDLHP